MGRGVGSYARDGGAERLLVLGKGCGVGELMVRAGVAVGRVVEDGISSENRGVDEKKVNFCPL